MTLAMDFDNALNVLRYITWPVEFGARLFIEFLLGIVLGVLSSLILFNIGYTALLCLTAEAFIFWGAVRYDLITIHWIRITKLLKRPFVQNHVNGRTPGLFDTMNEGEEKIGLHFFSYGFLLGAMIWILLMTILMFQTTTERKIFDEN